jgi:hypothetical protein
MEVQEDLRGVFDSATTGQPGNKIEGMELDYKILTSLIHFDIVGVQAMTDKKGDVYYLDYNDGDPKNLVVKCDDLKAKTRDIEAGFSVDADADAMNLHGIDLHAELCDAVAMEIVQEKNNELLAAIKENCHQSKYKFKDVAKGSTRMEFQILLQKMRISVAKNSRRGAGNFLIVPTNVLAIMHSFITTTADFEYIPFYDPNPTFGLSIRLSGHLHLGIYGKDEELIPVYVDQMSTENNWMITGYKGDSMLDVGAVYAPYHLINFTYKVKETPADVEGQMPLIDERFVGRTRDDFFGPRKDYFHMVELDMTEIDKFFEELSKDAA